MKKGVSATVIRILLLVIGLSIVLFLLLYFGTKGSEQTSSLIETLNIFKGGGGIV